MNATDYNHFIQQFKDQAQELEDVLSTNTPTGKDIEQISLSLRKLRTGLTEAMTAGVLPTYDQELCQQRVTSLEGLLSKARAASKPKSKFSFKSTANARPTTVIAAKPALAPASELRGKSSTAEISLADHARKHLTLQDATGTSLNEVQSLVVTIRGLSECFVDLTSTATPTSVNAVHVHDLNRTVLYAGNIQGSMLLHGCHGCTIIVSSHQFRMHTSNSTHVYLKIGSNPIVEKCTNIGFGPFPLDEPTDSVTYTVQDFDWMGESQSPNWHTIGRANFSLPSTVSESELDDVLSAILPQTSNA